MFVAYSMEKTVERMEESTVFASRLLEHGNAAEVLSLRRVVGGRMQQLLGIKPCRDIQVNLEFHTDFDKFQAALKVCVTNKVNL